MSEVAVLVVVPGVKKRFKIFVHHIKEFFRFAVYLATAFIILMIFLTGVPGSYEDVSYRMGVTVAGAGWLGEVMTNPEYLQILNGNLKEHFLPTIKRVGIKKPNHRSVKNNE